MIFHRLRPDGFEINADSLAGQYGCVGGSACVIFLPGPSASTSCIPDENRKICRFVVNGVDSYPAQFWTCYDNPIRFSRRTMLDPSIMKIVPAVRSHEVISGEDRLLKDCPNVVFFHNAKRADAGQLFGSGPIIDSRDSMLQAIDIAIRLGFKDIYLHGADLYVRLSSQQVDHMSRLKRSVGINEDYQQADVENSLFETLGSIAHLRLFAETDPKDMTEDQKQQIADKVDQLAFELDQISVAPLMYSFGNANVSMIDRVRADHHYRVCASRLVAARGCLDNLGVRVRLLESQGGRLSKFFENTYVQDLPKFDDLELSPDYTLAGKYKKVQ